MLQIKINVEIQSEDGRPIAQGEIVRDLVLPEGSPITVMMQNIADTVIQTIQNDTNDR